MINLSSFVAYHAAHTPDRQAVIYRDVPVSYSQFDNRIRAVGGWLAGMGVRPGDKVAAVMKNSSAFLEIAFAVSHVGAVFLPINYRLSQSEVGYILDNADARLLVVDEELEHLAPRGFPVFVADEAAQANFTSAFTQAGDASPWEQKPGDLFRLMYTSGTTDRPKGVMHHYDNFYWKSLAHAIALKLSSATRLLVAGPLYHVGAFDLPGIAVLWHGGTLVIHREFDPVSILASIERHKITGGWLAPVMTGLLLSCPDRSSFDLSSVKWVIGGGERTPETRINAFSELFTQGRYIDSYGLTESCSGDTFMEKGKELEKIGSTGRAVPHVEIGIRGEDGQFLAAGMQGEICLKGPKITQGYWKDPDKTVAAIRNGWFATGDVGYLDSDGFLFLTDRKKDMIISGGENIASLEVERVVYEIGAVVECSVVGAPDKRWGERVIAVVVLKPGATLSLEDVQSFCRGRIANFKIPKQLVIRASLPRNPSGKVLKRELRQTIVGE